MSTGSSYYWRRKWIPETCPDCGIGQHPIVPGDTTSLLRAVYNGWYITPVRKHPKWGIPCWTASCGACAMRAAIQAPSFLEILPKPSQALGPFTVELTIPRID